MFVSVVLLVYLALLSQSMPACQFRMRVVDSQIICLTKTSYPWLLLSVIIIVIRSILLNLGKTLPLTAFGLKILNRTF